jgi:hypothetical protein
MTQGINPKETIMKTLHTSAHYVVSLHPIAGLIVQSTRKQGGVCLQPSHPQYTDFVEAFETALDKKEADALCKALLTC